MARDSRYSYTLKITQPQYKSDGYGGRVLDEEVLIVETYPCLLWSPNTEKQQLIRVEYGLEPTAYIMLANGKYNKGILPGQTATVMRDEGASEGFKILSVHESAGKFGKVVTQTLVLERIT